MQQASSAKSAQGMQSASETSHARKLPLQATAPDQPQWEQTTIAKWRERQRSSQHYGCPEPGDAASGPSAIVCDAFRAGNCPEGCSVSKNATSAVVSAG